MPILQEAERRKTGIEQLADSLKQLATATLHQANTQRSASSGVVEENNGNSHSGDER
jgi:hypothetical protein